MRRVQALMFALCLGLSTRHAYAFTDGSGWVQVAYLSKILVENYRRFKQLQMMFENIRNQRRILEKINAGLDSTVNLIGGLPVRDEGLLNGLKTLGQGLDLIEEIYGRIPHGADAARQLLHDRTIAESLRMIEDFKHFSISQEENSQMISVQARNASPKGAARITAQSNAMILKSLSQLIRLQSQNLKLQSEILARSNAQDKDQSRSFNSVSEQFSGALKTLKPSSQMLRFR